MPMHNVNCYDNGKGKNESSMRRQHADLKSETMRSKGKCVYNPNGKRNQEYKQYLVSYCLRKMNPGKSCKKSLKSPGILFSYFCPIVK